MLRLDFVSQTLHVFYKLQIGANVTEFVMEEK